MRAVAVARPVLLRIMICLCAAGLCCGNDMYVVGLNDFGQLGAGDLLQRTTYSKITTSFLTYISGCSGLSHTAVIGNTAQHTQVLMMWGRNDRGQLGTGDTAHRQSPTEPNWSKTMFRTSDSDAYYNVATARPRFVMVACGEDSTAGVTDGGKVYSWGSNDYGQLGISDQTAEMIKTPSGLYYRLVPYFISSLRHVFVVAITAGTYHFAVLTDSGQVFTWGSNSEGQLGAGDFSQRNLPVPLTYFRTPVLQVQAGAYHTVFLDTFGHVYVCGLNSNGQLGVGQAAEAKTPNAVASIASQNITTVASGHYHVFGIGEDGVYWAWGANSFGQLGVGDTLNRYTPVPVSSGLINGEKTDFKAYSIFAGQRHSVVVTDSGDLYAFGNNDYGMLGTNDLTQRSVPTFITLLRGANVNFLASGGYHTLAFTGCFYLGLPCSGKGSCSSLGTCMCDQGYTGYRCSDVCPGGIGNACSLHGRCIIQQGELPLCICDVGFVGSDCSISCPGYAVDALGTPTVCTKHGLCLLDGSCLCSSGYSGSSCNMSCPSPASDSTPCSNLGRCVDGVCQCFPGFAGINCGIECKGGSENPCSLNGNCQADGSCVCFPGFRGETCSIECPGGAQNPCNGNGLCTEEGTCACFHGYRNSDCSKKCPGGLEAFLDGNQIVARECSGNGKCKVDGTCQCDAGFGRLDCSLEPPDLLPLIISGGVLGFIIVTALSVRYVLIKRRMAWIERERKRRMRQRGDADGGGGSKRVRNAAQLRTTTSDPKKKGAQNV